MADLYDPLTYENLMAGVALYFSQRPIERLDRVEVAEGPGIYALSYAGELPVYQSIPGTDSPIYVGKAVPKGWRKGESVDPTDPALRRRIGEHVKSINETENLAVADFNVRYLAVEPIWITLTERFLIDRYQPLWNRCLDGFGNHRPGSGRSNSERSWWDTLHPGRKWATHLPSSRSLTEAEEMVIAFLGQMANAPQRSPS